MSKRRNYNKNRPARVEPQQTNGQPYRKDGYMNVLNKYGTPQDNSEAYHFVRESITPDMQLTTLYEGNGLFSKIIDTPAEEAVKKGFNLNLNNEDIDTFIEDKLDSLDWEDKAMTAIKWARLYGGAIIVMFIDDGRGLDEPVDWHNIQNIDELRVYERAVVQADETSLYTQEITDGSRGRHHFGEPEYYIVSSRFGMFRVHESRCLVFRNGSMPEQTANSIYLYWGIPEYLRIKRALRETTTAHSDATKLLERSVQAIYSMKNLAQLLATDNGENQVLKRLQVIDMARGLLNSIAIDADGENYDFKTFQFSGVRDVIDAQCNMLSAITNIPQTILFGRSPAGMNATGQSDFENYYNFVERIQKQMLKKNLRYLLDVIFRAAKHVGDIDEEPEYKLEFNPLWSLSEAEQANVEQTKATTSQTKAQTAQIYVQMQALDPSEVRKKLAADEEFDIEDIIDDDDEDFQEVLQPQQPAGMPPQGDMPPQGGGQPEPQGVPQPDPQQAPPAKNTDADDGDEGQWITTENGHHVHLNAEGEPDKGNPEVVEKLKSGSAGSEPEQKESEQASEVSKTQPNGEPLTNNQEKDLTSEKKSDIIKPETGKLGDLIGSKDDIDQAIESGAIKMRLRKSKQNRHRAGTEEYEKHLRRKGHVSTIDIPDNEVDRLVKEKYGTGKVYITKGENKHIRNVVECGKVVGTYVSLKGKAHEQTTKLTIHFSNKGYHVVPAPRGGVDDGTKNN